MHSGGGTLLYLLFYLKLAIFVLFWFMPDSWLYSTGYNHFMCKYNYFSCHSKKNVTKYLKMSKISENGATAGQGQAPRRLAFFNDFLAATHTTQVQVAEMRGITKMTVYKWFVTDDCNLKTVAAVISGLGFRFEIRMTRTGRPAVGEVVLSDGDVSLIGGRLVTKRLFFLSTALKEAGVGKKELAEMMGIYESTVHQWFKNDDITFSRLYQVAETLGMSVYFNMEPKEPESVEGRKVAYDIRLHKEDRLD